MASSLAPGVEWFFCRSVYRQASGLLEPLPQFGKSNAHNGCGTNKSFSVGVGRFLDDSSGGAQVWHCHVGTHGLLFHSATAINVLNIS